MTMNKSFEALLLHKMDSVSIKAVDNYDLLFDGLTKKEYSVAIVDTFVRRHRQNQLGDFRVVKVFQDVKLQWIYHLSSYFFGLRRLDECFQQRKILRVSEVTKKYKLDVQKPNVEIDMVEFFSEPSMFTISILAAVIIAFGLLCEAKVFVNRYTNKKSNTANRSDEVTRVSSNLDANNQSFSPDLQQSVTIDNLNTLLDNKINPLQEDIASIKATLELLSNSKSYSDSAKRKCPSINVSY